MIAAVRHRHLHGGAGLLPSGIGLLPGPGGLDGAGMIAAILGLVIGLAAGSYLFEKRR